jgi:hypothetical protein
MSLVPRAPFLDFAQNDKKDSEPRRRKSLTLKYLFPRYKGPQDLELR